MRTELGRRALLLEFQRGPRRAAQSRCGSNDC